MAKNQDSFDMDKWSKGRKEKAEKPIKEKKEKETSFDMDDSGSFSMDKHTRKEKKEKVIKEKPLKEDNDTSFSVESKGKFDIKNAFIAKGKDGKSKDVKLDESGEFDALEGKTKKKLKIDLKDKKTRNILIFSLAAVVIVVITLITTITIVNIGNQIDSIYVSQYPTKSEYYVGEDPDYNGLVIGVVRKNGTTDYVNYSSNTSSFYFVGFDSTKAVDRQQIKVVYDNFTANFFVDIKEVPQLDPVLQKITLETLPKVDYKVGESLDTSTGIILCEYSDGSVFRVHLRNSHVSGFSKINGPGEYELTVKYKEGGILVTTTYTITVTE